MTNVVFPKTLLGFYLRYAMRPYLWITAASIVLLIPTRVAHEIMWPFYNKWVVDMFERPVPYGVGFVESVISTIVFIIGLMLLFDVLNVIQNVLQGYVNARSRNHMSVVLHNYVHGQSMIFFYSRYPGKIAKQIQYICEGYIPRRMGNLIGNITVLFAGTGFTLMLNWRISALMGGALLFRVLYGVWRMKPMNKAAHVTGEASSSLSGINVDSISNFSIVKLFAGAKREENHALPFRQQHINASLHQRFMERMFWTLPVFVMVMLFGMMLYICVIQYQAGGMTLAEVVFAQSIFWAMTNQIDSIVDAIPDLTDIIGHANQAYIELVKPVEVKDAANAKRLVVPKGQIEFKNLSFSYGTKDVLHGLNLIIKPGEKVGLVGTSGAGKTTLVNLLMRFYDRARGKILIDGQDIAKVTQDSLRENIAFIPQEPTMFNRSLRDNIAYGKPIATDEEIKRAAIQADADKFILDTKDGYESLVGDRGVKLSGGQRQRIAIARAFLKDAPILVLDEATSALDSETEVAIQKSFAELSRGRTTLVIAHRLSTLRNMDRIVVMEDGHIMESGTHAQLLASGGIYAKLWLMQSGGFLQE